MADEKGRKAIADRAAEIWKVGGFTYSEALDGALAERNPNGNPEIARALIRALLNVAPDPVMHKRHEDRFTPPEGELE